MTVQSTFEVDDKKCNVTNRDGTSCSNANCSNDSADEENLSSSLQEQPQSILKKLGNVGEKRAYWDESVVVKTWMNSSQSSIKKHIDYVEQHGHSHSRVSSLLEIDNDELYEETSVLNFGRSNASSGMMTDVTGKIEKSTDIHGKWNETTSTLRSAIKRDNSQLLEGRKYWSLHKMIGYSFWCIVALTIQILVGTQSWIFPDGRNSCYIVQTDGFPYMTNKSICELEKSLKENVLSLRFLSALVLGGFLVSSVNIWMKRRQAYGTLNDATRTLLVNICSIVPDAGNKKLLARWIVLGYELAILNARGFIDTSEGRNYLQRLNLIKGDEWNMMVNGNRHNSVWFWIQSKAIYLMKKNEISEQSFQTICNAMSSSRDKAQDLMSPVTNDQPPPYVWTSGLLITINLWFISIQTGIRWGIFMWDSDGQVWTEVRMYAEILMFLFFTSIYAILFDVCTILHNPFGCREIDVQHSEVGGNIRRLAKSYVKGDFPNTNETSSDYNSGFSETDDESEGECEMADKEISKMVEQRRGSLISIHKEIFSTF